MFYKIKVMKKLRVIASCALFFLIMAFLAIQPVMGQQSGKKVTITGVVVDLSGYPVPDAFLMVDGTKSKLVTDHKGMYKIRVKTSATRIGIFTSPPANIEERIDGRTTINFALPDSIVVQIKSQRYEYFEEEVNVGYGTEKRKNVTVPVSKIDGKKDRYASYNTIYEMIRGEVPGVQVTGTSIRIRDSWSVNGETEPLFVVNGTPVISIEGIHPQAVKSISILKGSAASIYGTRGMNGVILITLKNAEDNK